MAAVSGIKNTLNLASGSITTYQNAYPNGVGAGTYGVYNISFTNTTANTVQIRLYVGASTTGSLVSTEAIEWFTSIAGYGVFERTGIVAQAGTNFIVSSNAGGTGVNVNIYGIETSTS
jgi:hypothetical protein